MTAPFHAVGMLDPELLKAGYGSYREADGGFQMGATLDVLRGLGAIPSGVTFPIMWPANGKTTQLRAYTGGEMPDPLTSCAGYTAPAGLPIILQLGSGSLTPMVTASSFSQAGTLLQQCVFSEATYANPNLSDQNLGRGVLNSRDAIVLIPRMPLTPGATYSVSITANSKTYRWSFTLSSSTVNALILSDAQMQ